MLQNECICCKLFGLTSHLYSLAWACVRIYLRGSEDSMLCTLYWNTNPYCARTLGSSLLIIRTLGWSYHNIFLCSIGFSDPLIGYFFCRSIFQFVFLLQSLDPQYSLISFPTIRYWICAFDFTHIMRNTHTMGELFLYWPSTFFLPFRQSMPMGEKFRGFKGIWCYALVSFLSICLSCSCILALCVAWLLNSLYKPS